MPVKRKKLAIPGPSLRLSRAMRIICVQKENLPLRCWEMSDAYNELLEAAIHQLQELKTQGVRFVPVSRETLAALNTAPRPVAKQTAPAVTQPPRAEPRTAPVP